MIAPKGPFVDAGVELAQAQRAFVKTAEALPTLMKLEERLLTLAEAFETPEEDRTDEQRAELALLEEMLTAKVEGYCEVIHTFETFRDARKGEADRLAARAKTHAAVVDRLKARLADHMTFTNQQRIETYRWTLSLRSYPHVEVLDASAVPSEYQRTKIEVSVDRAGILSGWRKGGEVPPGVEIVHDSKVVLS